MDGKHIPSKWRMFADGGYKIRTRSITPEDSAAIAERFTDYEKMAEKPEKEGAGRRDVQMKYVKFHTSPRA